MTLTLATFVNHLNVIAWNPFLPFIAAEIGVTVVLLGQVPALMMMLATAPGLVIGPLADHYGYPRTFLICLLAVVTSSLATGLAATLPIPVVAALLGQTAAGGRLGDRPGRLILIGCLGSGPLIGLSLLLPLPAPAAVALMAAGWLMHGLIMVSTVVLLVGQSPAGRATMLTVYASAMNLGATLGAALGGSRWHRRAMSPSACAPWPCPWSRPSSSGAAAVSRRRHQHSPVLLRRGAPGQGEPQMIVDILVVGVHPDDAVIWCGGLLLKLKARGYRTGIVHLTVGDMGSRGTPEARR